ncbi:MAG: four helix bundle protein [Bacteroidota bacterium]
MSYKNLEIWKLAREVSLEIHKMTLTELPSHELYETGSQIRRSSNSVRTNIVEGYGRRRSKKEFLQFLNYALGSNYETLDHLEILVATGSMMNREKAENLEKKLTELGKKLRNFIKAVNLHHNDYSS